LRCTHQGLKSSEGGSQSIGPLSGLCMRVVSIWVILNREAKELDGKERGETDLRNCGSLFCRKVRSSLMVEDVTSQGFVFPSMW
jgi:hypothetical protein